MKILIVDDSRTGRSYILKTLKIGGVQEADVIQVGNGKEAIEAIKINKVKLVFLDINMPIMSGIEVVNEIATNNLMPCSQIVITSSLSDTARVEALKMQGVQHFLKKPFTPEALFSIYEILGK